ncbi:hypothetical protein M3Y96_00974500 [Aphelenchoides besseyi]|nr:hypothetical protein M3Y96_00974500 [Aphelenchoides besseyi]
MIPIVFFLIILIQNSDSDPKFVAARIGRRFRFDYDGPELIYQRCTRASTERQFAFRVDGWNGWTTDGKNRINEHGTRIHPNGTLEIDKFAVNDWGIYSFPQREFVCPFHVYTTVNGWIQDCEPNVYNWTLNQKNPLVKLKKSRKIQVNRGAYNPITKLFTTDETIFEVKIGKTVRLDFGVEHFVVARETDQIPQMQMIFSFANYSGGWTINGTDRMDQNRTRLYPNGTLVIKNFQRQDVGKYTRPLEPLRPLQQPLYFLLEMPGFISTTAKPKSNKLA